MFVYVYCCSHIRVIILLLIFFIGYKKQSVTFIHFPQGKLSSFLKTFCMTDHIEFNLKPTEIYIEIFLFLVGCSITAMSCYTSYSNETRDQLRSTLKNQLESELGIFLTPSTTSFSWAYGLGWTSTVVALVGTIISSFSLFISSNNTGNPTMTFKS